MFLTAEIFEAQMNRLHGSIPEVFDRLDHLKEINLHHNSFEGALPRTLGKAAVLGKICINCLSSTLNYILASWSVLATGECLSLSWSHILYLPMYREF